MKLNSVAFSSGFSFTYCVLSIFSCFYKVRGRVVNLLGHASCIMGHGSVFVWVSGSWLTACDHCLLWSEAYEFQPVAVEVEATIFFISELGHEISEYSGDPFVSHYFFQRSSRHAHSAI